MPLKICYYDNDLQTWWFENDSGAGFGDLALGLIIYERVQGQGLRRIISQAKLLDFA